MTKGKPAGPATKRTGGNWDAAMVHFPQVMPPPGARRRNCRPAQPDIPQDTSTRELLRRTAAQLIEKEDIVPPLTLEELCEHAECVRRQTKVEPIYLNYIATLVNNESWRTTVARIPCDRRLLLLPKCLRAEEHCPAHVDEFGLLCKGCGLCEIHRLSTEAEQLGYAVRVAEGSAVVTKMIETGRIEAIIGVSCLNVLEKCYPHMLARAVPGLAIPLLQDGCSNTTADLDWVRDAIHLGSDDMVERLNLDAVKRAVQSWFTRESLAEIMGPSSGETERVAREWLAVAGKRWRPYLTTCVYTALRSTSRESSTLFPQDLKKLAAAIECFHKASLVHDDIEDDDDERYGEQTLHVKYGLPIALNVGDFLLGEGYRLIGELKSDSQTKVEMLRLAAEGHLTLSRGQGAELCWARNPKPLSLVEVLDILRQKTAPAFEVALRLGAFCGVADRTVHDVLRQYSESLGIAYQIRDDLDDASGESDSHDLRDLRPSVVLALAHQLAAPGAEKRLIESLWNRTQDYDEAAEEVRRIIRERGVLDKAREMMEAYTDQATRPLSLLKNPTLKGLLRRVVGKIFGEDLMEGYCSEFAARNAADGEISAEPAA